MRVKILQTGKTVLRIILAGIVALAILSLLFCFYSLLPVHITNPKGNTDYIWPPIHTGLFHQKGLHGANMMGMASIIQLLSRIRCACPRFLSYGSNQC